MLRFIEFIARLLTFYIPSSKIRKKLRKRICTYFFGRNILKNAIKIENWCKEIVKHSKLSVIKIYGKDKLLIRTNKFLEEVNPLEGNSPIIAGLVPSRPNLNCPNFS